jgi:hypothetical protein
MSEVKKETIICPHCQAKGKMDIWNSVNVDLDPKLREKIFNEELFLYHCPNCGETTGVPYGTLYHDMTHHFMLFFDFFIPDDYEPIVIHPLAEDSDIEFKTEVDDNFPWKGIEGRVCDGGIFANTIIGKGDGCEKLAKDEFRENYIKGYCLHYRGPEDNESEFERREREKAEAVKEKEEKSSNVYALQLIKEFISEKLNGDIDKLREYNLSNLRDDSKYDGCDIPRSNIVKAIMSVVFSDVWPDLNVETMEHYKYWCNTMNQTLNLFGSNIMDEYFKGMEKFNPSAEQTQRAIHVAHIAYSIGNIWVLPNKATFDELRSGPKYRGYMDKFLQGIYNVLTGQKELDKALQGILYRNRKLMVDYEGEEGFKKLITNLMLEDYVNSESKPKDLFMFIWSSMKGLERDEYFKAFDMFCSFCEEAIPKRANRIIEKLKVLINR